jgi:hypothetical protein
MAQFPLEFNNIDSEGVIEAINYALSGPTGLGQSFAGSSDSYTAWLRGTLRLPAVLAGYTTPAHGASGVATITVSSPGSVRQNDPDVPSRIQAGQYVYGTNIATGAQVDASYDPVTEPWTVPLTIANTGAVQGPVTFYNEINTVFPPVLYVAPINISTIDWIDDLTIQVNFATVQPTPPFALGSQAQVSGNSNSSYNGTPLVGVVECTESYAILQRGTVLADQGTSTGGTIKVTNTIQPPTVGTDPGFPGSAYFNATDARGTVVVNGNLADVFISTQIDNTITYTATAASVIEYTVAVNRYIGTIPTTLYQGSIQYYYDATIASQSYQYSVAIGSATLPTEKTVFANIKDEPNSNLYLYRIDLLFRVINDGGAAEVTQSKLGNRSMSVQVVKQ